MDPKARQNYKPLWLLPPLSPIFWPPRWPTNHPTLPVPQHTNHSKFTPHFIQDILGEKSKDREPEETPLNLVNYNCGYSASGKGL